MNTQITQTTSPLTNFSDFGQMMQVAEVLSRATMVPEAFRGNPGDVLIALNVAKRFDLEPLMVLQNMYIVHGSPSWSGKFISTLVNKSGKYRDIEYLPVNGQDWQGGLYVQAIEVKTGKVVKGPAITPAVVQAEGWLGKNGSKWRTMPEMMYHYRAMSWFAKVHCPEVVLGMSSAEELADEGEKMRNVTPAPAPAPALMAAPQATQDFVMTPEEEEAGQQFKKWMHSKKLPAPLFKRWADENGIEYPQGNRPKDWGKFAIWFAEQDGLQERAEAEIAKMKKEGTEQ